VNGRRVALLAKKARCNTGLRVWHAPAASSQDYVDAPRTSRGTSRRTGSFYLIKLDDAFRTKDPPGRDILEASPSNVVKTGNLPKVKRLRVWDRGGRSRHEQKLRISRSSFDYGPSVYGRQKLLKAGNTPVTRVWWKQEVRRQSEALVASGARRRLLYRRRYSEEFSSCASMNKRTKALGS